MKYLLFLKIYLKIFSPKIEFILFLFQFVLFFAQIELQVFVLDLLFPVPLLGGKIIPDLAKLAHKFSVIKSTVQIETLKSLNLPNLPS